MKITISTQDMKAAVSLAVNTLGTNQDITSHFVFVKDGNGASVMSCNLPRTFSKVPLLGAQVSGEGSFTMEGKRLLQILGAVSGVLEIESSDEDKTVKVSLPKGKLALTSLNTESFPSWSARLEGASSVKKVPSGIFFDTLNSLKAYVSQEDSRRPELAMVYLSNGDAYACDGFGMSVARHADLAGVDLKIHTKDVASVLKFLKANDSDQIEVLKGDQAYFLKSEDGAVFGMMDIPHKYPQTILNYSEAFDWTPQRVWGVTKSGLATAIKFLRAGADKDDVMVTFSDEGDMLPPKLSMRPATGSGGLSYNLEPVTLEDSEQDPDSITSPDERMFAKRLKEGVVGDEPFDSFSFNWQYMNRAMESMTSSNVFIGCTQENNRGYMVFKTLQPSNVETVSVVGWMV
jgi:hypothetical protein